MCHKSDHSGRGGGLLPLLLALLALVWVGLAAAPAAARQEPVTVQALWESATAADAREEWREAAGHFERLHREFANSEVAEEALWRAARLRKQLAEQEPDPDWQQVGELFRRYSIEYPKSGRRDEAYLEIGISHFRMRFFREALTYFRLFAQRYPDSPLLPEARYWQGLTLMDVGRRDEAIEIFRELIADPALDFRLEVMTSLALAYDLQGAYWKALDTFHELQRVAPVDYHLSNPEVLFRLGLAYSRLGREEEARERLWHFVNLAPPVPQRREALFALGESYYRQGNQSAAQRLYAQVLEEGRAGERAVVLARFRQVSQLDDLQQEQWRPRRDPADRAGDLPYLAVIEQYGLEPIAQDARYGLLLRSRARDDLEGALELARSYVRHAPTQKVPGIDPARTGELLIFLVEELLKRGEYERIYHLYASEHHHVQLYEPGRLRFLIGRALEELALYEQAAVVYYRALAGTLSAEELAELYYRRVGVYFALRDFPTADRLLTHLRRIYAGQPVQLAEAYALSGALRQLEGRYEEALGFFRQATGGPVMPPRWAEQLPSLLRTLEALKLFGEMPELLSRAQQEGWLGPEALQAWYRRAGDGLRRLGLTGPARDAYAAALAAGMPQDGEEFQVVSLELGTLLAAGSEPERSAAEKHLQAATAGPDPFLDQVARQRLNQFHISGAQEGLRSLFSQ